MQDAQSDALIAQCRSLATTGAWDELCRVASAQLDQTRVTPSLITMYAEGLLRTGDPHSARRWLDDSEGELQKSGDRAAIRRAVNFAGAASFERSDLDNAALAFERAAELGRIDGDDLLVARATNNLAVIATIRGRHEEALGLYAIAFPAYQRLGNVNGLAESYHNAAIALRKLNRLDQADQHEQRSAEFAGAVNNNHLVALTLVGRAEISLLRGDAALAEATADRAARYLSAVHDPSRQADAIRLCASARFALGKLVEARDSLNEAVSLAVSCGNTLIEAESRWCRAQVVLALGEPTNALDDARRAASIFHRLHAPTELAAVTAWVEAQGQAPS